MYQGWGWVRVECTRGGAGLESECIRDGARLELSVPGVGLG